MAKVTKITGDMRGPDDYRQRPERRAYAQPTTQPPNTMRAERFEDVFIPFYDRPGYMTDNADMQRVQGQAFVIPSGDGRMEQRNLGE